MKNKLSKNIVDTYNPEKITRYSIRKASFGATSVAVAAFFMYLGQGTAAASDTNIQDQVNQITSIDENKNNITENTEEKTSKETVVKSETNTLDKTKLSSLIAEIESKIVSGAYDSKTEDSVSKLKVELGTVKTILESAKTQEELARAYNKLVTATTQLKTKPEEKKEAPAVDTTNGQPTVGKKATNTEKSTESNSIANSGSKDERNGKALNTNNPFRTDAATTDIDPAANQTYTAPAADADLNTLVKTLLALDPTVENNTRLSQNMDSLGDSKEVAKGAVKEINEFGGWTAVDGGVFAIARRTEEGVYPLETINSTLDDTVWLQEQAFDRDTEYTLLLSKSRTRSNRDEVVYDNSTYKPTGEGGGITKNLVRYKGIEKTFTAYSTKEGSDVIVKFKPGYVGDSEGSKANYKVQVYSITGNQESLVYETTFDPSRNINDGKQIVTAAKDGTNKAKIKISDANNNVLRDRDTGVDITERPNFIGKEAAEKLMAQPGNKPNGTAGTFTSKPIALPKGADHYKVRISLADQNRTGMSYQAWDDKYSVPVTGDDFSIAQDTSNVARNLLQRIYDKLKATESADKNGKTSQTIQDYEAELEKVKALLANPAARTPNFKQALQDLLAKQSSLKTDKTGLTNSKAELDALVNEDPTPGKTTDTAKAYNAAKEAAKTEIAAALTVINDENATPEQVSAALEKVNAKKTALQQAKDGLIVAATAEEKAKLKSDADSLVKADTTGKTPNSIEAYNTKYEAIKAQLEAAKTEAAAVLAKENNASKAEVQAAQTKVDAAKAELTKAVELLVNKADKTELTNAKEALNTLVTETDPTTGKTADSAKVYNDAKTAAQEAIKQAETVINDENATPEQVTEALNKVNEKKSALEAAKQALVTAATAEEKAKLKADADLLTKADETGKTPDSIAAYERKYEELKAQLEAAKTEAAAVLAKGNNATKEEVKAAQAKVDAVKTELENAKNLLVEAATTEEKNKLKADADSLVKVDTTGKTADSIKAYESEFEKLKAQLEAAKTEAAAVLAKGNNATKAEVQAAQAKVDAAKTALDKAAESLKDIDRDAAKKEIADAAKKATDAIEASTSLTQEQKAEEKAKVAKEAKDATDAIDNATTEEGINSAKENGKLAIEKEAAITAIKAEKAAKEQEIDNNTKLSDEEKAAAKAEVAKAATESVEAITKADTKDAVEAAKIKGEAAIKAVNPIGKAKALDAIQKAAEEKIVEIDKNDKLSAEEKAEAKAEVAKAAIKAVTAIQEAKDQATVNTAEETGVKAIKAVTPVGKAKALDAIQKAAEEKIAEIDKNDKLSAEEKAKAKAEVAKAATEAVEAIQKAETQDAVDAAQAKGETAIKAVTPVGKAKALDAIQKAAEEKIAEIDKNDKLSAEEKAKAKAEVAKAATEAVEAIQKAETQDAVDAAQAKGETAIKAVNPIGKALNGQSTNKDALTKATTTEAEAIKGSPAYYNADETKKAAYDKALEEAKKVLAKANATQAEVDAALKALEEAKAALNGQPTNKDALTKAVTTEAEATKGSPAYYNADETKKAAYDKALEEAKKVLAKANATQAEVDAALKALEEAKAALNGQPTNKDALTKATTTDAEETKGSPAYYNADEAKKAAYDKALAEAKKVLENDKATQAEVNAALKALEEAKAALNGQPTNKDALTKATTTDAEETKGSPAYYNADEAKKAAYDKALAEAKKVLENDKATQAEVNAALKALEEAKAGLNGYVSHKINPAISEVEEFDITELIVKGIVEVEKGQTLNENDIKSKLNLPDGIEIVEIEYPETNTLGRKVVRVVLRGNDGNLFTVEVPVEVVEGKGFNNIFIGNDNSANNGSKDKVDSETNQKLLPNTGITETNTGLAGLGLAVLGGLLAVARRRKEK